MRNTLSKLSFEQLEDNFNVIQKTSLEGIKGGEQFGTAWMDLFLKLVNETFDFSASSLTYEAKVMFKGVLSQMLSTDTGFDLLNKISNSRIKITADSINDPRASASYEYTGNTLNIGPLDTSTIGYSAPYNFGIIAHELYHAYQDNVLLNNVTNTSSTAYLKDAKAEIDATLFAYITAVEFDIQTDTSFNDSFSKSRIAAKLADPSNITPEGKALNNAWNDMFVNGNFSLENYNALISNMAVGSTYKIPKDSYVQIESLNNTGIDELFHRYYDPQRNLFNKMIDNYDSKPSEIITDNPTIHAPLPPASGVGGGGGGGDSGTQHPVDASSPIFWPAPPPNDGGDDGGRWSDKTGMYWSG